MRLKTLLLFVFLLFTASCRTTQVNGYDSAQVNYFRTVINHACFFEGDGGFSAQVSSSQFPSVRWEGKWTNNFEKFQSQLVDPTGRALKNNPFKQLEEKFGPKGLRSALCGQIAFERFIVLEGHKIKVKSTILNINKKKNETTLETLSEFYYGLFSKKSEIKLMWKGRVLDGKVTPTTINFGSSDEFVTINFLEYE